MPNAVVASLIATALASAALARPDLPAMETLSLDGLWEFAFVEDAALADAKCDFAPTGKMPVPGCFDLSPEYRMKRGTAMYRTRLRTERDALNAYLVVKGMGLRVKFWIDGREIGSSKLAYSELEFETGPLAAGEHVVEAALDNRLFAAGSEMFQPFYDFFASGGFYHGIALKLQRVPALVHFQPPGSGGRRSIQEIPGQKNQLRWMPAQAFQDRVHVLIVGVCQQRRGNRAGGNVIACLDHSEPPFDRVATVYHRNRTEARAGKLIGSSPFGDQRGTADFILIAVFPQRSKGRPGRKLQKSVQYAQKVGLIFSEYFFDTSCGFPPWGIK